MSDEKHRFSVVRNAQDLEELLSREFGWHDHNMSRDRPYNGQPHTHTGLRGATEVAGVTFRDLRDCYIRAIFLSAHHIMPAHCREAEKGERSALCENDLYGWDMNQIDPIAVFQNFACEVERIMGIFPNIPKQKDSQNESGC